jgi:hypothetical protein
MTNPTHKPSLRFQAHWQNAQSQRDNQILPKSLTALPAQTHGLKDNAAKINDRFANDKNGQLPTSYIKHLAVSGLSGVLVRIKSTCNLTGKCFEMPNVLYTYSLVFI